MVAHHEEAETRRAIVEVGRRLWTRGLIGGAEGNVSVRLDGALVATPSGACKGFLDPDDLVVTDLEGRILAGAGRPSSELRMHVRVYRSRSDVRAVVHAHPPTATGFAIAGQALDECVVPEVIASLGRVPIVPYGTPSTEELPDRMAPYVASHDALLLANHGVVTYASSLARAIDLMESIEQAARSLLTARILGRVHRLSSEEVDRLLTLDAYEAGVRNPGCLVTDPEPLAGRAYGAAPSATELDEEELRRRIATIVRDTLRRGGA
ncbi:MAG: class II aldolase/adducin family protein [Gemmatimonadota bacterium]